VMDYQHLTKDRSLGTVELKVGDLAQVIPKGAGDPCFSHGSTGRMDKSEPIRLDRGNQHKGQLHYVAEFLPAFILQGLKFETGPNELQAAVDGVEGGDGDGDDSESMSSSETQAVTRAITTREPIGAPNRSQSPKKNSQLADTTHAAASTNAAEDSKTVSTREGSPSSGETHSDDVKRKNEGVQMSKDDLLTHRKW
jgi:hypothetical protein